MDTNNLESALGQMKSDPNKAIATILEVCIVNQAKIESIINLIAPLDPDDPEGNLKFVEHLTEQTNKRISELRAIIFSKIVQ